jgi:hypothetical protein
MARGQEMTKAGIVDAKRRVRLAEMVGHNLHAGLQEWR